MTLHLSPDLGLPLDAVTDTFGILGKKGSGKTSAAVVLFEELFDSGVPAVALDPKGDWFGVRSSGDGKGPGLPVPVLGGRHGDVALEPTGGAVVADLVLAERLSCVLDVSEFSRADVVRFLLAFATRLYRQAESDPLHLLLEECHEYLPQVVRADEAQLVGAWQRLVKQGRFKGLGVTLISQRSAAVNKDVLEQVDNLVVMRTTGPRDRAAIKGWVDTHADPGSILDTLPSLANGEAWLWAPEHGHAQRFRFRMRRTFDAGATPKVGESRKPPATLADVDLGAIKDAMAETIEKAKADDPKELRKRIADLERQLRDAPTPEPERVHVPDGALVAQLRDALDQIDHQTDVVLRAASQINDALMLATGEQSHSFAGGSKLGLGDRLPAPEPLKDWQTTEIARSTPVRAERSDNAGKNLTGDVTLPTGPRSLLVPLVQRYPAWLTRTQVVVLAKRGQKSSALDGHFAHLVDNGLAERNGYGEYRATDQGADLLGHVPPSDPIAMWRGALKGADLRVFDALVADRGWMTRDEIADYAGLSRTSSAPGQALVNLRRNGLIDEERMAGTFRAHPVLFA